MNVLTSHPFEANGDDAPIRVRTLFISDIHLGTRGCQAEKFLDFLRDYDAYDLAISLNTYFNAIRRLLGLPYWSLSRWIKLKVKNAVNFIGEFEKTLAAEGRRHHVDGVVCGHIHHPVIRNIDGLVYVNC